MIRNLGDLNPEDDTSYQFLKDLEKQSAHRQSRQVQPYNPEIRVQFNGVENNGEQFKIRSFDCFYCPHDHLLPFLSSVSLTAHCWSHP